MIGLSLAVLIAAALPSASPESPTASVGAVRPGAIAFGSPERKATSALGQPTKTWVRGGFQWRRYIHGRTTVELAFYRDKLGIADVHPAAPIAWPEAKAWVCALAPGFDATKLHKDAASWTYFENVGIENVPFEIELTLKRQGDRTTALHGEMHWLD
jgi:hypothetical protein